MDRFAPPVRPRLEPALGLRTPRQRDLLGTLPRAVDRVRAPGRERHPARVLVPQHRGQRDPLHLLRRPPRPGRHARLRAELLRLRAEPLADPQTGADAHGPRRPVTTGRDVCLVATVGLATLLPYLGSCLAVALAMRVGHGARRLPRLALGGSIAGLATVTKGPLGAAAPALFGLLLPLRRADLRALRRRDWATFGAGLVAVVAAW